MTFIPPRCEFHFLTLFWENYIMQALLNKNHSNWLVKECGKRKYGIDF